MRRLAPLTAAGWDIMVPPGAAEIARSGRANVNDNKTPRGAIHMTFGITRRAVVVGGLAGSMAVNFRALAESLPLPTSPVTLNFVDVAGNLALTQKAIEAYRDKNPKLVAKINFTKAPAPELPGKIKAQQDANRVDIDAVLTGIDALSA